MEYKLEDELFLKLKPKIFGNLKYKLNGISFNINKTYSNQLDIVEDLYHDSFIIYRNELKRKNLVLNENITENELIRNIWQIVLSRFYGYYNGNSPRYFENLKNSVSLDYLFEIFEDMEELNGKYFPNYSQELYSDINTSDIIKYLYNKSDNKKNKKILSLLLEGYNQAEICNKLKLSRGSINGIVLNFRINFFTYLGNEFNDFKENIYEITDKRVLKNKLINEKIQIN